MYNTKYGRKYVYRGRVKHCCKYCGTPVRYAEYEEFEGPYKEVPVDEKGYATRSDSICPNCSVKIAKKGLKGFKWILILFIAAALIGGGLLLLNNSVFGSSGVLEWAMNKKLDQYESSEKLDTDSALLGSDAAYTMDVLRSETDDGDYRLRYYTADGRAEVKKYTLGEMILLSWSFKDGFGELSGKTYTLQDGVIYEDGAQKISYSPGSAQYSTLMEQLNAYLPENCCGKGSYTSAAELDDPEKYLIAHIIKGDSDTILFETTEGKYYEKTADKFIYMDITKPTEGDSVTIPEKSEYTAAG